jgi:hypothetical protein
VVLAHIGLAAAAVTEAIVDNAFIVTVTLVSTVGTQVPVTLAK